MPWAAAKLVTLVCVLACAAPVDAGPSSSTTTTSTSTVPGLPACAGEIELDPEGSVALLTAGVATEVPIRVTLVSGVLDLLVSDGGAGGQAGAGCIRTPTGGVPGDELELSCLYTPPANAPSSLTLTARLEPHSPGHVCGPGSTSASSAKTLPVGATTTSTSTTVSTSTTSTTTTLPGGKVAICHKARKTRFVEGNALRRHLRHGDAEGPCSEPGRDAR